MYATGPKILNDFFPFVLNAGGLTNSSFRRVLESCSGLVSFSLPYIGEVGVVYRTVF